MLKILAYSLLTTWTLLARAAPFPQATPSPASVSSIDGSPATVTPTPTSAPRTDLVTFSGVEVTSPTEWNLLAGNARVNGANIALTRSDTTFLARLKTDPARQAGGLGGTPTTVTNAEGFDVSPTHLALVAVDPSLPDALELGYSCDVQGTQLKCTIIGYSSNTTDIIAVYSALYEVAPTEVTAAPAPTGQALNAVVNNEQLADLFASAFNRVESDAATVSATADWISYRSAIQSSFTQSASSYFESLRTAETAASASSTVQPTSAA